MLFDWIQWLRDHDEKEWKFYHFILMLALLVGAFGGLVFCFYTVLFSIINNYMDIKQFIISLAVTIFCWAACYYIGAEE